MMRGGSSRLLRGMHFREGVQRAYSDVLTADVIDTLHALAPYDTLVKQAMAQRAARRASRFATKKLLTFLPPDHVIPYVGLTAEAARKGAFTSSAIPKDLECQWVQGTGPAARPGDPLARNLRGVAYALLSGADGWMFDGEDAMGQAGTQSLEAQRSLRAALAGTPLFMDVAQEIAKDITKWAASFFADGKGQVPPEKVAEQLQFTTRIFRPRGLHLDDRHVRSPTGSGFSASLVDVVLYCVHNAHLLLSQGRSVVLYLPKIQTAGEAALWGEILAAVERHLGLPRWCIKTYVLVEQVEAAFQLLEIRAALGERFVGFNTGRWDYIHSVVDAMAWDPDFANPDISAITMRYPYMAAYERRVFRAANTPDSKGRCSLWQGGMEQQIPVGSPAAVKAALAAAVAGAERERDAGASGKWVAHWKMVHVVRPVWAALGQPNLAGRAAGELTHTAADAASLLQAPSAKDVVRRTARGARELVSVALQYGAAALAGLQSVALKAAEDIGNDSVLALMEDMATAEIRVGILWEWVAKGAAVVDGASSPKPFTSADFEAVLAAEMATLKEVAARDAKATQPLPLLEASAAAIRAAVLSPVKAPWYCDVLNCALGASSPDEVKTRVTAFFDALRTRGHRTTEPLDFPQPPRVDRFQKAIAEAAAFFALPRFRGQTRLHTARDVAEQQGTLIGYSTPTADSLGSPYPTAAAAAESMWSLLRRLAAQRSAVTTFGPYSPSQAVCMARAGIQGTYLGGWATSAKGDHEEDPGPDLASYPLSRVPKEAAALVRAMVTADRNQMYSLARGQGGAGANGAVVDFMPRIIADADTGHGGDAHVRNLVRRFTEAGVAGCHIEDQKPGVKKCGHQGGKVLVPVDEFIRRLAAARLQYDIMRVPGIIVARTDAEAATLLDGKGDERDMPYVLGATNLAIPSYRAAFVAMLRMAYSQGVAALSGHKIFSLYDSDAARAEEWLESSGLSEAVRAFSADVCAKGWGAMGGPGLDTAFDSLFNKFSDKWAADAQMRTFPEALAAQVAFTEQQGEEVPKRLREVVASLSTDKVELDDVRVAMRDAGIDVPWSADHARTPDGYFQIRGGIPYAVTRAVAVAPFCDIIWMETKTADLHDAREFADAVHAKCPGKLLAYNLSPSFNWDTTGMSEEEMADFPRALGQLGFVFNFITYGGHQIDGAAAEDFSASLRRDGMLALARLQRKLRLVESPYRTPQSLVGGPRADSALTALTGRTSSTKAMGKGSTQFQHLIATELSPKLLDDWLAVWARTHAMPTSMPLRTALRPHVSIGSLGGSELLELSIAHVTPTPTTATEAHDPSASQAAPLATVVFALIKDRRGHVVLSVRDQTTAPEMRRKRLMALCLLFLLRRYHVDRVNFVTPTPDNRAQAQRMLEYGFFTSMREEVGEIIRCAVAREAVEKMCAPRGEVPAFIGGAMPSCARRDGGAEPAKK